MRRFLVPLLAAAALCGCAGHQPRLAREYGPPPGLALLPYDTNHDGKLTRAELEAGLHAEFARFDKDHNGCLSPDEVMAINEARWAADRSATPLVDWESKGCLSFDEFAAEPRSLFAQLDIANTGVLTDKQLKSGGMGEEPAKPLGAERPRRRSGGGGY